MVEKQGHLNLRRCTILALAVVSQFMAAPLLAHETLKSKPSRSSRGYEYKSTHPLTGYFGRSKGSSKFSSKSPYATVIDGNEIVLASSRKLPSLEQMSIYSCGKGGLCDRWSDAEKSYDAAARAFGIPAPILICITKIESGFRPGQTSSAGARGLTQFMPPTAKYYESLMTDHSKYRDAWSDYQRLDGTRKSSSAFTASNITSSSLDQYDVQIFATAMYFRNELEQVDEKLWGRAQKDPDGLRKVWRYLAISYNGGGKRARTYLKNGLSSKEGIPEESRDYVDKLDKCIDDASKTRYVQFGELDRGGYL